MLTDRRNSGSSADSANRLTAKVVTPQELGHLRSRIPHSLLGQVAGPLVPPVEMHNVAGQQLLQALAERAPARAHQAMEVVRQERPGLHDPVAVARQRRHPGHEVGPVIVARKGRRALAAPPHDMVQRAGGIQPGLSEHGADSAESHRIVQLF